MDTLNYSSQGITLRAIGINYDQEDELILKGPTVFFCQNLFHSGLTIFGFGFIIEYVESCNIIIIL